jgi:two-component system cell cycle response regulator CtrA
MRVLLCCESLRAVALALEADGFTVQPATDGEEALDLAELYEFDAMVCDSELADMDVSHLLAKWRAAKREAPVLVLSGYAGPSHEVAAFKAGADDFLTKPFHVDVLRHRVRAMIRRSRGHASNVVTIGPIQVDLSAKTVSVDGRRIHLTPRHYQMIELMALRSGVTLTKQAFMDHLYGGMDEPELKIIDVFICKIRAALKGYGADGYIETVWGRGYRMTETPDPRAALTKSTGRREGPSAAARVLAALRASGDMTFRGLCAVLADVPQNTVRSALQSTIASGEAVNVGGHREALYRTAQARAA